MTALLGRLRGGLLTMSINTGLPISLNEKVTWRALEDYCCKDQDLYTFVILHSYSGASVTDY